MGRLFGTNGVRGIVNRDLTAEMVMRLAATAGSFLGRRVLLGRDGRTSSPLFKEATISGLTSVGCNVFDAGLVPTPALQFAVKSMGFDGGLMVTASHNPPEFNGVKVIARDGVEIPREMEDRIEAVYFGDGPKLSPWDEVGAIGSIEVNEHYCNAVISHVDSAAIRKAHFKVSLDPGNGVATLAAPRVAQLLGCAINTVNAEIDGLFPSRDSEPRPDNLGDLRALVESSGSDLGVAFDGDADRAIFIDEKGEVHWGDRSFALVVKEFLREHPRETVATPVSSSRVVEDVVATGGGRILWTVVGSVVVSRTMLDKGIVMGGEENGGIMYGPHQPVRDGSMALALILDIMAKEEKPLSRLLGDLPQYRQTKGKVPCPNELKERLLNELRGRVEASRVETIDGLKLWYPDGSWILVRPSGTEPIFRLYAEAEDQKRANGLVDKHVKIIEEIVEKLRG